MKTPVKSAATGVRPRPRLNIATTTSSGLTAVVKHPHMHRPARKAVIGSESDVMKLEDQCMYFLRNEEYCEEVQRKLIAMAVLRTIRASRPTAKMILPQLAEVLQKSPQIMTGAKGEARDTNRKLWSSVGLVVGPGGFVHRPAQGGFKETISSLQAMKRNMASNASIVHHIRSALLARFGSLEGLLRGPAAIDVSSGNPFKYVKPDKDDPTRFDAAPELDAALDAVDSAKRDSDLVKDLVATMNRVSTQRHEATLRTGRVSDPRLQRLIEGLEFTKRQVAGERSRLKQELGRINAIDKNGKITTAYRTRRTEIIRRVEELSGNLVDLEVELKEAYGTAKANSIRKLHTSAGQRFDKKMLMSRAGFRGKGKKRPVEYFDAGEDIRETADEPVYYITRQARMNARRRLRRPNLPTKEIHNGKLWNVVQYGARKTGKGVLPKVVKYGKIERTHHHDNTFGVLTDQPNMSNRAIIRRQTRNGQSQPNVKPVVVMATPSVKHEAVKQTKHKKAPRRTRLASSHGEITEGDDMEAMSRLFAECAIEPFRVESGDEMMVTYYAETSMISSCMATCISGSYQYRVPRGHAGTSRHQCAHRFYQFLEETREHGFPLGDTRVSVLFSRINSYGAETSDTVRFRVHKRSPPRLSQIASSHGEISEGDDMPPKKGKWIPRETCVHDGCKNLARSGRTTCIYHPDEQDVPCSMEGCNKFTLSGRALCASCFAKTSHNCGVVGCTKKTLRQFCHAHRDHKEPTPPVRAEIGELPPVVGLTVAAAIEEIHPTEDMSTASDDSSSVGVSENPPSLITEVDSEWAGTLANIIQDLGDDFAGHPDPGFSSAVPWGSTASQYEHVGAGYDLGGRCEIYMPVYDAAFVQGDDVECFAPPMPGKTIHRGRQIKYYGTAKRTPLQQDLSGRTRLVFLSRDRDMTNPMLWNEIPRVDAEMWRDLEHYDEIGLINLPSRENINASVRGYALVASALLGTASTVASGQSRLVLGALSCVAAIVNMTTPSRPAPDKMDPYYTKYEGEYFVHVVDIEREIAVDEKPDQRLPHQKSVAIRAPGISSRIIHRLAHIRPTCFQDLPDDLRDFERLFYKVSDYTFDHQKAADCYYEGGRDLKRTVEISVQKSAANHTINVPWRSRTAQLGEELYYKARFFYNFSALSSRPLNCVS